MDIPIQTTQRTKKYSFRPVEGFSTDTDQYYSIESQILDILERFTDGMGKNFDVYRDPNKYFKFHFVHTTFDSTDCSGTLKYLVERLFEVAEEFALVLEEDKCY